MQTEGVKHTAMDIADWQNRRNDGGKSCESEAVGRKMRKNAQLMCMPIDIPSSTLAREINVIKSDEKVKRLNEASNSSLNDRRKSGNPCK